MSLLLVCSAPAAAQPGQARFIQALDRMMVALGPESARDGRLIQKVYEKHLDLLVLDDYGALERAHWNGGIASLPPDPSRFNLAPRLQGYSPIGEKDLVHQVSYVAARPSTIGALLDLASRVKSGPLEITSMVRHTDYQGALRATNVNANTAVPMHTMGLAFDIALVNTPLQTVYEIRDVLREMRAAGEILFVGERKQLVFHVVPHPRRLGYYTDVYAHALGMPPSEAFAPVVAFTPAHGPRGAATRAQVTAEVIAVVPTVDIADEWWAAADYADLAVDVIADDVHEALPELTVQSAGAAPDVREPVASLLVLLALLMLATGAALTRRHVAARVSGNTAST